MNKFLFLAVSVLAVMQAWAAHVDLTAARDKAQRFLTAKVSAGKINARAARNLELGVAMPSAKFTTPAFYIFNSDGAFVIVAGDDRAQEILAYGDGCINDLNSLPENMRFWLDYYCRQMEFLMEHPDLKVSKPVLRGGVSVEPLISVLWDQGSPYYNQCPVDGDTRALTGCAATSLAQIFYKWQYPIEATPAVPGYSKGKFTLGALPSVVFDWDNMLPTYRLGQYEAANASAVAQLMRYIGQAEQMNYDKEGSEAYEDDILRACHLFGYEDAYVTYKSTVNFDDVTETTLISDEDWSALMQSELVAGRPMVFCAYDYSYAYNSYFGHAFDVDGYNATDGTFHINWGWSGTGNGYFALNAFSYQGTNYHIGQLVVMGIEPPADAATIKVFPETVNVEASPGKPATATFTIKGRLLNGDITMTLNDPAGVFSLDANSVSVAESQDGKNITVTYVPQALGSNTATVTLSSPEAADKTVTINGTAVMEKHDPVMLPVDSNYISLTSYRADWTDETPAANVESYTLEVSSKPDVKLVAEADFSTLPSGGNVGSQASQYLPEGWTLAGSTLYLDGGCITPTSGEKITTCPYDFTAYDQLTVVITAKSYSTYSPADVTVSTSKGSQKVAFSSNYEEYVVVLDCSDTESIQFLSGYYPMIQNIKIYAGNLTAQSGQRVEDEGDTSYRLITGITDKFYMVTGLTEAGTFFYKVKAQFADGSDSAWSNPQVVTLFDNGSTLPTHELGDVNHDGDVNISDAITLINYLLNDSGDICTTCANVNGDDEVNITDAIDLINMLLNNV